MSETCYKCKGDGWLAGEHDRCDKCLGSGIKLHPVKRHKILLLEANKEKEKSQKMYSECVDNVVKLTKELKELEEKYKT